MELVVPVSIRALENVAARGGRSLYERIIGCAKTDECREVYALVELYVIRGQPAKSFALTPDSAVLPDLDQRRHPVSRTTAGKPVTTVS